MLIKFEHLMVKYGIELNGILHIGAHECEEINVYEKYIQRDKILWVDALPEKVDWCKEKYSDILIENAVVSNKIENTHNTLHCSYKLQQGYYFCHVMPLILAIQHGLTLPLWAAYSSL